MKEFAPTWQLYNSFRQTTLSFHNPCLEILTVLGYDLNLFMDKEIPLLLLIMSSKQNFLPISEQNSMFIRHTFAMLKGAWYKPFSRFIFRYSFLLIISSWDLMYFSILKTDGRTRPIYEIVLLLRKVGKNSLLSNILTFEYLW